MHDESLWRASALPSFPAAPLPSTIDVAIIGGGITGLTTAYLLKRSGKRVAVFERETIGSGDTGSTTAHLTQVTDTGLANLVKQFGDNTARLVWEGNARGIDTIETIVTIEGIDCGFSRVPGFKCAPFFDDSANADELKTDAELAARFGFDARYLDSGPLTGKPAISFPDQGLFHPLRYLAGLATAINGDGSFVFEHAEVSETRDDPLAVVVNGETIACKDVVIATHVPLAGARNLVGAALFQTKLYPYSSYVLGARIDNSVAPGLYDDSTNPYFYLRVHDTAEGRYAIFGGEDHKTGVEADTNACFNALEERMRQLLPSAQVDRRWSGQVIETSDGLPFIGKTAEHQYVGTGYAGNGMTFGTLAAMMLHDAIIGVAHPLAAVLDPHRKATSLDAMATVVSENARYPFYMIRDRLRRGGDADSIEPGDGRVVLEHGKRVAVHRTDEGQLIKVSAVCTHLGCLVRWNDAERTWDCPCHGSRFTPDGLVLGGPAETPLARIDD